MGSWLSAMLHLWSAHEPGRQVQLVGQCHAVCMSAGCFLLAANMNVYLQGRLLQWEFDSIDFFMSPAHCSILLECM